MEWFCLDCGSFADDEQMVRKTEMTGEAPAIPITYVYCPCCLSQRIEPEPDVKDVAETARRIHLEGVRSSDAVKSINVIPGAWLAVAECLDFIVEVS